ncbi:unnamed protein product [Amoebophrya sp. A25]|nr:unnamed protein product [Amoebophrya sp. A25]|eukprot:GSA25T00022798001.1
MFPPGMQMPAMGNFVQPMMPGMNAQQQGQMQVPGQMQLPGQMQVPGQMQLPGQMPLQPGQQAMQQMQAGQQGMQPGQQAPPNMAAMMLMMNQAMNASAGGGAINPMSAMMGQAGAGGGGVNPMNPMLAQGANGANNMMAASGAGSQVASQMAVPQMQPQMTPQMPQMTPQVPQLPQQQVQPQQMATQQMATPQMATPQMAAPQMPPQMAAMMKQMMASMMNGGRATSSTSNLQQGGTNYPKPNVSSGGGTNNNTSRANGMTSKIPAAAGKKIGSTNATASSTRTAKANAAKKEDDDEIKIAPVVGGEAIGGSESSKKAANSKTANSKFRGGGGSTTSSRGPISHLPPSSFNGQGGMNAGGGAGMNPMAAGNPMAMMAAQNPMMMQMAQNPMMMQMAAQNPMMMQVFTQMQKMNQQGGFSIPRMGAGTPGMMGTPGLLPTKPDDPAQERMQRHLMQKQTEELERWRESEKKKRMEQVKKCHLHTKAVPRKCKFCKRYEDDLARVNEELTQLSQKALEMKKNLLQASGLAQRDSTQEYTNQKSFNLPVLLLGQIEKASFFKELVDGTSAVAAISVDVQAAAEQAKHNKCDTVEKLVAKATAMIDNCDVYLHNSMTETSTFMACLLRLFMLRPTMEELKRIVTDTDNVYIRIMGFLFIRFVFDFDKLWAWYSPFFLDMQPLRYTRGENLTVGEVVERLFLEDRFGDGDCVLPRIPHLSRQKKGLFVVRLETQRDRYQEHMRLLRDDPTTFTTVGRKIEACSNGDWLTGTVVSANEFGGKKEPRSDQIDFSFDGKDIETWREQRRLFGQHIHVRLEDESFEEIPLGKVILLDYQMLRSADPAANPMSMDIVNIDPMNMMNMGNMGTGGNPMMAGNPMAANPMAMAPGNPMAAAMSNMFPFAAATNPNAAAVVQPPAPPAPPVDNDDVNGGAYFSSSGAAAVVPPPSAEQDQVGGSPARSSGAGDTTNDVAPPPPAEEKDVSMTGVGQEEAIAVGEVASAASKMDMSAVDVKMGEADGGVKQGPQQAAPREGNPQDANDPATTSPVEAPALVPQESTQATTTSAHPAPPAAPAPGPTDPLQAMMAAMGGKAPAGMDPQLLQMMQMMQAGMMSAGQMDPTALAAMAQQTAALAAGAVGVNSNANVNSTAGGVGSASSSAPAGANPFHHGGSGDVPGGEDHMGTNGGEDNFSKEQQEDEDDDRGRGRPSRSRSRDRDRKRGRKDGGRNYDRDRDRDDRRGGGDHRDDRRGGGDYRDDRRGGDHREDRSRGDHNRDDRRDRGGDRDHRDDRRDHRDYNNYDPSSSSSSRNHYYSSSGRDHHDRNRSLCFERDKEATAQEIEEYFQYQKKLVLATGKAYSVRPHDFKLATGMSGIGAEERRLQFQSTSYPSRDVVYVEQKPVGGTRRPEMNAETQAAVVERYTGGLGGAPPPPSYAATAPKKSDVDGPEVIRLGAKK